MTLIAGFLTSGCPILMGDLLISSNDKLEKELVFPTVGKISNKDLSNTEYRPTEFCQKINILSRQLAIAWAGRKIDALTFIQEVGRANLHKDPSREALLKLFHEIDGGRGKFSIIGILRNKGKLCLFAFNAQSPDISDLDFQYLKVEGTGYNTFSEIISISESDITSGQPNNLEKAISKGIGLSSELLAKEISTPLSLQNLFGVGYEVLHPLKDDLVKFHELTYLFWKVKEVSKRKWEIESFPFLASRYSYQSDLLVIRSARLSSNVCGSCKVDSDEVHFIKPIYRTFSEEELIGYVPDSFNSTWMCNVFIWEDYHRKIGALSSLGRHVTQSPPVIWKNEFLENEGIDINKNFLRMSVSKIAAKLNE